MFKKIFLKMHNLIFSLKRKSHDNNSGILALSANSKLFDTDSSSDLKEYKSFLDSAFANSSVRNIAITGNLGVGKSSIIRSFESTDRRRGSGYLYISLMDFTKDISTQQSYKKSDNSTDSDSLKSLQQNFERYLLCQILSRLDAQTLPHSIFKLIPSKKRLLKFFLSIVFSIIVFCIFGILNGSMIELSSNTIKTFYYLSWFACTITSFLFAYILGNKLYNTKFKAKYGGFEVETQLQNPTGSYIDDNIFEIVYALETISKKIGYTVVLEDMDRLGRDICVDIFSKLRRINYIINDRNKLRGKYIRFIYAFNDTVFELTKNTKFFDYVMSITPKLNYNTAGEYFKELILGSIDNQNESQEKLKVIINSYDKELWKRIGLIVHDYRTINHIKNDFQLFVNLMIARNFQPTKKWLLFVIYKNILPEDYSNSFEQGGILELDKEDRNKRIENLCYGKEEKYSEFVKYLFDYLIDVLELSTSEFKRFTGVPQEYIDIRNNSLAYSNFKQLLNPKIDINQESLTQFLSGKKVLVTGGGGSIGSELCRQVANYDIESLLIIDISENNLYSIEQELKYSIKNISSKINIEIASIQDKGKIDGIFNSYKPNIVLHAAAFKHVPLMESNPVESIKNNIIGTYNVVRAAEETNVEKFILVSTDKAINPTNIMGITKRFCELIISNRKESNTIFCAVRFGNVLGSNGSVIPLFERQIKNGGPITITHRNMIRYFMTIPEACDLILQASSIAEKSKIYVLDMGEPIKIIDLAENLIRIHGLVPNKDIAIVETGLRPGEKLYEELLMSSEGLTETQIGRVFQCKDYNDLDYKKIDDLVQRLEEELSKGNDKNILINLISDIVPVINSQN